MIRPFSPRPRTGARPGFSAARWMPLLLLLLSLGIVAGAIYQAQQAVRSHRAAADGALAKYASFGAWEYRRISEELLGEAFSNALGPAHSMAERVISGKDVTAPLPTSADLQRWAANPRRTAECVPHYGAPYFFRVPLENTPEGLDPDFAGTPPDAATRDWVANTVRAHAASGYAPGWHFAVLTGRPGGTRRHLVYSRVPGPGQAWFAYGFEFDPGRFRALFEKSMDAKPLLPPRLAGTRKNREILSVRVFGPDGTVAFQTDDEGGWERAEDDSLSARFGGMRVLATVRPSVANSLVIGGLPRSRLPLLVGLLLLAAGLTVLAVVLIRREGELARMRSDFVSSVSHELRTPLAQVRLFMETLRLGRYRTDQQREWLLDNMERETTRLTTLVDNVLHFSRSERGGLRGELEVVALHEYVPQVVDSFAPLAATRRVELRTQVEPGVVARLDPEAFRQVLLNLLDNAVKYGPHGQTVRVSAALEGAHVRIAVEDEGPGVDAAERERIWEPFRRGERAIGSVAVGSGIGLAVVREIVAWHGGSARVEDGERGARFVVEVPGWRHGLDAGEGGADARRQAV
ncbi:MAG TPA: HAMP domain-containing sensor histidine kinase [Longimicrobium sp.]|nr:HAMP domain-containing sensor histidine kinase [Longimicrobium sp.]